MSYKPKIELSYMPIDEMLQTFEHKEFKVFTNDLDPKAPLTKKGEKVCKELCDFLEKLSNTAEGITFNRDDFQDYIDEVIRLGW